MKKLTTLFKIFLLALPIYSFFNLRSTELTTNIARKMKYYDLLHDLRLKANERIRQLENKVDMQINHLRKQNRYKIANTLLLEFTEMLKSYSSKLNQVFDNISQILVIGGYKLDEDEAPVVEKIRFVQQLKKRLLISLDIMLKQNLKDLEDMLYAH